MEALLGLPTGSAREPRGSAPPAFVEGIERDLELLQHVRSSSEGWVSDYRRAPTRDLLRYPLDAPRLCDDRTAQEVRALTKRLACLSGMRNDNFVAHGFTGISREAIERVYVGDCLADLCALAKVAGVDPDDDPFVAARNALLEEAVRREQARS
jgi:hypothetical protein